MEESFASSEESTISLPLSQETVDLMLRDLDNLGCNMQTLCDMQNEIVNEEVSNQASVQNEIVNEEISNQASVQTDSLNIDLNLLMPTTEWKSIVNSDTENVESLEDQSGYNMQAPGNTPIDFSNIDLTPLMTASKWLSAINSNAASLQIINDPGLYDFKYNIAPGSEDGRHHWTFSEQDSKLYVQKSKKFPVGFSTNKPLKPGTSIRGMVLFSAQEWASEPVNRCHDHLISELKNVDWETMQRSKNILFMLCHAPKTTYEIYSQTKRQSVIIPFTDAPAGSSHSIYLFEFQCLTSCQGGPNRRAMRVVFTLEYEGIIFGKCCFEVRICANPMRDRGIFEEKSRRTSKSKNLSPLQPTPIQRLHRQPDSQPANKKLKCDITKGKSQRYSIEASDEETLSFLKRMKRFYRASSISAHDLKAFCYLLMRSSDESSESSNEDKKPEQRKSK